MASAEAELLRQQPVIKRDVILMDAEDVETIDGEHASKASEGTPALDAPVRRSASELCLVECCSRGR